MATYNIGLEGGRNISIEADQEPTPEDIDFIIGQQAPEVEAEHSKRNQTSEFADPENPTPDEWKLKEQLDDEKGKLNQAMDIARAVPKSIMEMGKMAGEGIAEGFSTSYEVWIIANHVH